MPFFGTFLRKLGHFSFHREDPQARLQQAKEIEDALRNGESVFVFPEGTFTAQSGVRAISSGRVQSGHRGATGDRAHRARGNAARVARRHLAAASRAYHHYNLPADCSAVLDGRLARNRARARLSTRNHRPFRSRTSAVNSPLSGQPVHKNGASHVTLERLSHSDGMRSLRVGLTVRQQRICGNSHDPKNQKGKIICVNLCVYWDWYFYAA